MKQYDIEYCQLNSGAIRLEQNAYGGDNTVDLHPMQLRAIAEHFGLVTPQPPADEFTQRLAEHLCSAYLALLDEQRHWSHGLEELFVRLDAQIDCLPSSLFPEHLWEERKERECKLEESLVSLRKQPPSSEKAASNTQQQTSLDDDASDPQIGLGF